MKAVCFDLDGTLIDPRRGIIDSLRYALERLGYAAPERDEDLTWCIGPPLLRSLETLLGDASEAKAALTLYRERFAEFGIYENEIYPGIRESLAELSAEGQRLFVATSKPTIYATEIIRHLGLSDHFEAVFGSELDGTRSDKRELLAWVLKECDLEAADTTMVGDRSHDVVGARANGIPAIGVLYGYGDTAELTNAGAIKLCNSPYDLPEILAADLYHNQ